MFRQDGRAFRERAEYISRELRDAAVVIQGDALDKEVLLEANVQSADTIIAVTTMTTNIFASVRASARAAPRAITLVNRPSYEHVLPALGIDRGREPECHHDLDHSAPRAPPFGLRPVYAREGFGEVSGDGPGLAAGQRQSAGGRNADGMLIGAIVRNGEVIIPTSSTRCIPATASSPCSLRALRKAEAILAGRRPKQDQV
jgi:trk system potassium uptake protein TrkA